MSRRLSGAWFKLVDTGNTYLGALMMPEVLARHLEREKSSVVAYQRPPPITTFPSLREMQGDVTVRQYTISKAYYPMEDAVMVFGITPDDLALEPGFAFLPNADYLLAKLQPKPEPVVVAPRPEPPGPYLAAAREFAG